MIKGIAVDLEKDQQSDKVTTSLAAKPWILISILILHFWVPKQVKELEATVLELLEAYNDCTCFSEAIQSIRSLYQPSDQVSIFFLSVCDLI